MSAGFLEIEKKYTDAKQAKFVVLPVCYEETASYLKGTAKAPQAILDASQQIENFDELLLDEFYQCGIHTAKALTGKGMTPEEMQEKIYRTAKPFVDGYKILLSLGGEHSITPALVKTVAEKYPDVSVLQIDAHADLRNEYHGSKFNHACVMRRIFDMRIPFVGVGIRSIDKEQHDFICENKIKMLSPVAITHKSDWIAECVESLSENVYITLDIDGLDPSFAPGTGTPEPGGLSYQQASDLIIAIGKHKTIVGADIVEVIPKIAGVVTEVLAARLGYRIIAAAQLRK